MTHVSAGQQVVNFRPSINGCIDCTIGSEEKENCSEGILGIDEETRRKWKRRLPN